jgi:hypothetical protein
LILEINRNFHFWIFKSLKQAAQDSTCASRYEEHVFFR